ncbi:ABC transporter substrate-binding protein [Cellulomonas sp. ACRRI]|uniref:ABC transporter substrate-binding protein n=1 Tax=Cellulomonas sp. ACRRI TaxID=2918188 RepID=UPI001EF1C4CF|nr:ABC transporter substrate-binding protein [Cellulomonas sp. ACRRI]MCG7284879.1 ABC transporter substrate-binding protein [Cellulomonas sp. ACRRI]
MTSRLRSPLPLIALGSALALAACSSPVAASDGGGATSTSATQADYDLVTPGTLTVAAISDGSPNAYIDETGEFTGFDVELLREVADRMGLETEFSAIDFTSLLASITNGQYDTGAAGVSITDSRKETVDFTSSIYFAFLGIVAPAGSDYSGFEDLEGQDVLVANGTVQDEYATQQLGLEPTRFPDQTAAFQALISGQGDAWLAPFGTGTKYLDEYPDAGMEMVYSQLNSRNTIAFPVSKDNPELTAAMDEALDEVIEDGTWYELVQEFYPGADIPEDFTPGSADVAFERP